MIYDSVEATKLRGMTETLQSEKRDLIEQRDDALVRLYSHQRNVPCSGCRGGHDTFWQSVVSSPQWKAWETTARGWDVYECAECGHISQAHFQAFLTFCHGYMPNNGKHPCDGLVCEGDGICIRCGRTLC
jgi:hypothetical protein